MLDCNHHWSHFHDGSLCETCWLIRLSSGQWLRLFEIKPDQWLSIANSKTASGKSAFDVLRIIERLYKPED